VLCDEYFNSGVPFHFSPRQLLRRQLRARRERSALRGRLEIEWYLARVPTIAGRGERWSPGVRGGAQDHSIEPGYSYHSNRTWT